MSDESKAPAWRVFGFWPSRFGGVKDGDRIVCWVEREADACRIVEAVNGLAEARRERDELRALREQMNQRLTAVEAAMRDRVQAVERERDELRAELAALRGAANTVWRVGSIKTPDGVELWSVYEGGRLVMAAEDEAQARLVAAAPGCLRVADGARAELGTLRAIRERAAVEHHGAPASTYAALVQAAERLTATVARHEELLGIGAPKPDEIAKLRKVALAVADWLEAEGRIAIDHPRAGMWVRAYDAVRVALGCADVQDTDAALRALAGGVR